MQKITITAPTLNEALQEVKKRFGENAIIENTEELNNKILITVGVINDVNNQIIVPSLHKKNMGEFYLENPLSAIRLVESICKDHNLGQDFQDFWLKNLSPYLVLIDVNLADPFSECLQFEPQWTRKILKEKPVIFLGTYGSGKTQTLAKVAALLKVSDREVEIYNLDTVKASGQGMLEAYAKKLNAPYYFGQEAWQRIRDDAKDVKNAIKLIDTPGVNLDKPKEIDWLKSYTQKFGFETVMLVPADACFSQTDSYIKFIKDFHAHHLIISKADVTKSLGLPIRVAWLSNIPIAMVNNSAQLGDNLQCLNAQKLLQVMHGQSITPTVNAG
jgi:flagellar biosynthesis GTPase FlhF